MAASNVADADSGGCGNTKAWKGEMCPSGLGVRDPFQNTAEHFPDVGDLDKTSAEREPKADAD